MLRFTTAKTGPVKHPGSAAFLAIISRTVGLFLGIRMLGYDEDNQFDEMEKMILC